jgi:uncharacterized repeat protein (TIGR04138 family)
VPRSPAAELLPLAKLLAEDPRYKLEAYQFVGAGLEYAQQVLGLGQPGPPPRGTSNTARSGSNTPRSKSKTTRRGSNTPRQGGDTERSVRHVSGQELCGALKELAHRQYGLMAKLVLASWGVRSTSDFGVIVFNLIRIGKMSKSDRDCHEDFENVFDFEQALVQEFAITKEEQPCRP